MWIPDWLRDRLFLMVTALVLALLLWGGVAAGRTGAVKIALPVRVTNLAPGLVVRGGLPATVEVTITGPRLLLYQLRHGELVLSLDFAGVRDGVVVFEQLGQGVDLIPGLDIVRTVPGRVQVWVEAIRPLQRN